MYAKLVKRIRRIFHKRGELTRPDLKKLREYRRKVHKEYIYIWRLYVDEGRCISDGRFIPRERVLSQLQEKIDDILHPCNRRIMKK